MKKETFFVADFQESNQTICDFVWVAISWKVTTEIWPVIGCWLKSFSGMA